MKDRIQEIWHEKDAGVGLQAFSSLANYGPWYSIYAYLYEVQN